MERLLLKATAVTTDIGDFVAIISTESIDREKDIVSAGGMVAALRKWNRPIPLAWNHSTDAADIIGHIDPTTVEAVNGEVQASGKVDLESEQGREAWRSFKSRTVGFSFGYLILDATDRAGGGKNITGLDVFEVSATPTPMNADTRVLDTKAVKQADQPPSPTQLRILNSMVGQAQEYINSDPDAEDAAEMADVLETLEELLGEPGTEDEGDETDQANMMDNTGKTVDVTGKEPARTRSVDPLREKADALILEIASDGESLRKSPPQPAAPKAQPEYTPGELRRVTREHTLTALRGELEP